MKSMTKIPETRAVDEEINEKNVEDRDREDVEEIEIRWYEMRLQQGYQVSTFYIGNNVDVWPLAFWESRLTNTLKEYSKRTRWLW